MCAIFKICVLICNTYMHMFNNYYGQYINMYLNNMHIYTHKIQQIKDKVY